METIITVVPGEFGQDVLTCNIGATIELCKCVSWQHAGRILAHHIRLWMRTQPKTRNIYWEIGYVKPPTEGSIYCGLIDSEICAPRNVALEMVEGFCTEWCKYLKLFPEGQLERTDCCYLTFCLCEVHI